MLIMRLMQLQLLNMLDQQNNLFIKLSKKIRNFQHFQKILDKQEQILDFRPFKIESLTPEKALKIYKNLHYKYNISQEFKREINSWHECEKGLFVWFMVIYTYYLAKDKTNNHSHSQQKIPVDYHLLSNLFFGKSTFFLQFQFLNLLKFTQKIIWTQHEDSLLKEAAKKFNNEKWTQISMQIFARTKRQKFISSKMCRERWHNHLDESKVKGNWSLEEDFAIIECVVELFGKKWSKMKGNLGNRRTEHMIKNRYNSLITKNRVHKHEKERDITKRLLEQLRQKLNKPSTQKQIKPKEVEVRAGAIQQSLKVQNVSSQSLQEQAIQRQKNEIVLRQQEQKIVEDQDSKNDRVQEDEGFANQSQIDENNVYPFSSYNYELEIINYNSQLLEFHKNQMLYLQQYMPYQVMPTLETYQNSMEYQGLNNIQLPEGQN